MSTITKEWLQQKISKMESRRDEPWLGLDEDESNTLAALRIALASLEAEPVAWLLSGGGAKNNVSFDSGNAYADPLREVTPLYTAPPAPVVEDIGEISVGRLPTMNQDDYPGLGDWWVQLRTGKDSDEVLARVYGATPQEANSRAEALACRAAMLQGADSVSQPYKLRDGWVAVPVEPTAEMISSGIAAHYERSQIQINDRPAPGPMECAYMAMLAAAPQQEVK